MSDLVPEGSVTATAQAAADAFNKKLKEVEVNVDNPYADASLDDRYAVWNIWVQGVGGKQYVDSLYKAESILNNAAQQVTSGMFLKHAKRTASGRRSAAMFMMDDALLNADMLRGSGKDNNYIPFNQQTQHAQVRRAMDELLMQLRARYTPTGIEFDA